NKTKTKHASRSNGKLQLPGCLRASSVDRRPPLPECLWVVRFGSVAKVVRETRPDFPAAELRLRGTMLGVSIRRFATSALRRAHYEEGPGKNIPFSVENKWRLLILMSVFCGSGFVAPFIIVRHQLLKQ
uniref:Cytochrome c oxidase subunit 7C, mitochondrial n=2 Tax=Varanus komodoensis TaxID=61221 RepID=A0A8D2L5C0_VARKO